MDERLSQVLARSRYIPKGRRHYGTLHNGPGGPLGPLSGRRSKADEEKVKAHATTSRSRHLFVRRGRLVLLLLANVAWSIPRQI